MIQLNGITIFLQLLLSLIPTHISCFEFFFLNLFLFDRLGFQLKHQKGTKEVHKLQKRTQQKKKKKEKKKLHVGKKQVFHLTSNQSINSIKIKVRSSMYTFTKFININKKVDSMTWSEYDGVAPHGFLFLFSHKWVIPSQNISSS